jgi:hypothetical protein
MTVINHWGEKLIADSVRSFISDTLIVPKDIDFNDGQLLWNPDDDFKEVEPDDEIIFKFANLATEETAGILRFAREWGVLGLCRHNLPATHNPPPILPGDTVSEGCSPSGAEAIEVWYRFARIIRAMISIAAQHKQEHQGYENDWLVLLQGTSEDNLPTNISSERQLLSKSMNLWIGLSNIQPRLKPENAGVSLSYPFYGSLFGVLGIQLMTQVGGDGSLLKCAACGVIGSYRDLASDRWRRPKVGARFYCDDCRIDRVPQRRAERASRQRKKLKTQ